jgi:hypothetical protein
VADDDAERRMSHIDPTISANAGQTIAGNRSPNPSAATARPVVIET